jgi:hypothetical protein
MAEQLKEILEELADGKPRPYGGSVAGRKTARSLAHNNPGNGADTALQLFNGIAAEYDNLYGAGTTTTWTDPT